MNLKQALLFTGLVLCAPLAIAQSSYSIDWYAIGGGGGTSTGGVFSVSGTSGEPSAGQPLTGGNFSLSGGFWSIVLAPTITEPITIFDNLGVSANSVQYATSNFWLASKICIRTQTYSLESVTLELDTRQPAERPSVRLRIYSHEPVGDKPAADTGLVLNLSGTTNPIVWRFVPSTYAQLVKWVPETPFVLEAGRCYWVVFSAENGEVVRWIPNVPNILPSGPAGTLGRSSSPNAGATWAQPDNSTNFRMLVKAMEVANPGAPSLAIEQTGSGVRIFWPLPASGFVLEQSLNVIGAWSSVTSPFVTNGNEVSFTVPAPTGSTYYRLRKP